MALLAGVSAIASVTVSMVALQQGMYPVAIMTASLAECHYWVHPLQFQSCYHIHGRYGRLVFGLHVGGHLNLWRCQECAATIALLVPAIALGLPGLDHGLCHFCVAINGRPIFQPDKGHIHHRLLAMGFSQRQAVIFMYLISAGLCLAAVLLTEVDGVYALVLLGVLITIIFIGAKKIGILKDR